MTELQNAIDEVARLINGGVSQDEIKDTARRLTRGIPCEREETKIPVAKSRVGFSYFSDDEYELAWGSYMDDLTMHQIANLIGLAYDQIA